MAVFPERMNKLDVNDIPGSLKRIESYINYMAERMEFSNSNMTRNVSNAGVSSVEILTMVQELAGAVSLLNSTVAGLGGSVTQLSNRITELQEQMSQVEEAANENRDNLAALTDRVSDLEERMGE